MPKIHDITLTPEMERAMLQWLEDLPSEAVKALRQHFPGELLDPWALQRRLKATVRGADPLPSWLLDAVKSSLPASACVAALTAHALRDRFDVLLAAAGPPEFLLALAADDRPDVQELAVEHLRASSQVISEAARKTALQLTFAQFTGLKQVAPTNEADKSQVHAQEAQRLKTEVAELERTAAELKTKLQKERAARDVDRRKSAESAKSAQDRLTAEISKREGQITGLHNQIAALERMNSDLEKEKAVAIKAGVQAELAAVEHKWLADAITLESIVSDDSSTELVSRVNDVLEEQKKQDRHSRNRLELKQRLEKLRDASQRLRDTRENALHPIRDLATVAEQVHDEIARIESKLGVSTTDAIAEHLLPQINECADFAAVQECARLVDSLHARGIIALEKSRRFYEVLQRRHDVLAARPDINGGEADTHWLSLQSILHRNLDCLLLLDGYNILFALDYLQPLFENDKPGSKAREALTKLIRKLLAPRPNLNAHIFFDGPNDSVATPCPNLKVKFTGGRGGDRADQAILRHLKREEVHELRPRTFVVTNDRSLQALVVNLRAHYMPVGAFDATLRKFHCLA